MELVKTGKQHTLPLDYEQFGMVAASVCADRDSYAELRLYDYEETLQVDPSVAMLIQFARIAALEDDPELSKESGPHADPGGEVLERMYIEGSASIDQ